MAINPPNLLIFMSDQHSRRVLGCEGDPFIRTPNLDALAASGVRFGRAYCASPLCYPSRMTFLTSRHCSEIQVWSNESVLRADIPTFAHSLAAAGYETILCGRMHNQCGYHNHGFERHLVGDLTPQWPGGTVPDLGHIPGRTTGQNRDAVEIAGPGRTSYQAFDHVVTAEAIAFLKNWRAGERPFCLVVGYAMPHCPFIAPKPLFDEYHAKVDVPRLSERECNELHPAIRAWRRNRNIENLSDEKIRSARAAYYGLVTECDTNLGKVMTAFNDAKLNENTAVFYTSDHGEMAGKHEMWWKSNFYEESVGIPLIASWPQHFAEDEVVQTPVSLLDLAPTLIDLAGGKPLPKASGRSLRNFLTGEKIEAEPPRSIVSEYGGGFGDLPSRMLVQWPWKLVVYHGYEHPQLFNLDEDPQEIRDLAQEPNCAEICASMIALNPSDWSGEKIVAALEEETQRWQLLIDWTTAVQPPEPDHWFEPQTKDLNVFPE